MKHIIKHYVHLKDILDRKDEMVKVEKSRIVEKNIFQKIGLQDSTIETYQVEEPLLSCCEAREVEEEILDIEITLARHYSAMAKGEVGFAKWLGKTINHYLNEVEKEKQSKANEKLSEEDAEEAQD